MKLENRFGRFTISWDFIDKDPLLAKCIMGRTIILRAEASYDNKVIVYVAHCDEFREIPEGTEVPEYVIKISDETGIEFKEVCKYDLRNSVPS